ncbi:MAG: hypothetical protein ACYDA5_09640 [Vulcanimicrobiaceae bacterium]
MPSINKEGRFSIALAALVLAVSACSGGSTSAPVAPKTPMAVQVSGPLTVVGDVASVVVTQGSYVGPYIFTSSNGSVLALSNNYPSPLALAAMRRAASGGTPQTLVSSNGKIFVTALAGGTSSISITGQNGASSSPPPLQNVTVGTGPGPTPLTVTPATLSLYGAGAANAQSFVVSESGYTRTLTESDTCNPSAGQIATVSPTGGSGPSLTVTVTGVAAGSCSATFTDAYGSTASVAITVTTSGWTIQTTHTH